MNISNLEFTQATIEIFGGFICLIYGIVIAMNGYKRESLREFKNMYFTTAMLFFSEAVAYVMRGETDGVGRAGTQIANFLVFILNYVLARYSVRYAYCLIEERGKKPKRIYSIIVDIGVLLALGILLINFFTGWMYYFDEANYYHRNNMWFVYTAGSILCIGISALMAIRYRKYVSKGTFISIMIYAICPILAIVIQTFLYGFSIANIGIAVCLMLMLFMYLKDWYNDQEEDEFVREKGRKSLQTIVLFAIMVVCMSASIISFIMSINRLSADNAERDSRIVANMVSDSVDMEFVKPIMVATTMSNDYTLKTGMIESGSVSAESVEGKMAAYLDSIRKGFGYQMVYTVCNSSKAYYTYDGISKFVDIEHDIHDVWYRDFLELNNDYDLNVDTDADNNWALSVFVNKAVYDDDGNRIAVCGVGVEMPHLQEIIQQFENSYNVKINLVDESGLVQLDTDVTRIETVQLDNDYLKEVSDSTFYYEDINGVRRLTKYMKELDWYLVIQDNNTSKFSVIGITLPSILIFMLGLIVMGTIFLVINIREQKATDRLRENQRKSITDSLTGLFNRRGFDNKCESLRGETSLDGYVIILMDINGLKVVNDNIGHSAGDELIIGAANCMNNAFSKIGNVYRTGGDEFVAILKCSREKLEDALKTFDHMTDGWRGTQVDELTISKGIAICSEHSGMELGDIINVADKRMYDDKAAYYMRTGKDRRKH